MQITTCQFNDSYFPIMDGVGMTARKSIYHPWEAIVDEVYQRYIELIRERQPAVYHQWEDDEE
jgi:hypothetical protein